VSTPVFSGKKNPFVWDTTFVLLSKKLLSFGSLRCCVGWKPAPFLRGNVNPFFSQKHFPLVEVSLLTLASFGQAPLPLSANEFLLGFKWKKNTQYCELTLGFSLPPLVGSDFLSFYKNLFSISLSGKNVALIFFLTIQWWTTFCPPSYSFLCGWGTSSN